MCAGFSREDMLFRGIEKVGYDSTVGPGHDQSSRCVGRLKIEGVRKFGNIRNRREHGNSTSGPDM